MVDVMKTLRRLFSEKTVKRLPLLLVVAMFSCAMLGQNIQSLFNAAWILVTFIAAGFITFLILAPKLLPIDDSAEEHRGALRVFLYYLIGLPTGLALVREGKVVSPLPAGKPGARFEDDEYYSPRGVVVTDSTSIVALKTETGISRATGPGVVIEEGRPRSGVVFTDFEEEIDTIIDLRPQLRFAMIKAQTRDGILVDVRVGAFYGLKGTRALKMKDLARPHSPQKTNPFAWREASAMNALRGRRIERKVDKDEKAEWGDRVMAIAVPNLRQIIARYPLDNLTAPFTANPPFPRHPRFIIRGELIETVRRELDANDDFKRSSGLEVRFMTVSIMWPPPQVIKQRIESWKDNWRKKETEILGQAEADAVVKHEQARAQAQGEMTARIYDTLQEAKDSGTLSGDLVTLRFLEAMEKMAHDPTTRARLTIDSLDILRQLREMLKSTQPENRP
jgi:hypothetical protein